MELSPAKNSNSSLPDDSPLMTRAAYQPAASKTRLATVDSLRPMTRDAVKCNHNRLSLAELSNTLMHFDQC